MSIPPIPKEFNEAKADWEAAKLESANLLSELKKLNIDLYHGEITSDEFTEQQFSIVRAYIQISEERKRLHKIALEIQSEAKFLHFKSFQFFLGEIGWAVGLLLYALINLLHSLYVRNRYFKKEFTGKILLDSTLLFVGCFYTFYVFYTKDDFSKTIYFVAMLVCTVMLILASKLIVDTYSKMHQYLRDNINSLIAFIFRIRNKHYRKVATKAMYAEKHDIAIAKYGTLEDNYKEFDNDFYTTIHKIRT